MHSSPSARAAAWAALCCALAATTARAAPAYVQGICGTSTNSFSVSATLASPSAQGDLLLVALTWDPGASSVTTAAVTDSVGNAYVPAIFSNCQGTACIMVFYASNAHGGASTVTATLSGPVPNAGMLLSEYSGVLAVSPLDVVSTGTAGATTALTSGSATTTSAPDLIYGASLAAAGAPTPAAAFTTRFTCWKAVSVDLIGATARAYSVDLTAPGTGYSATSMTTWKSAALAGLGTPCTAGSQCASTFCVDAVCCASSCGGGVATDCLACDGTGTCASLNGPACSDGNACTHGDRCVAGACVGTAYACAPGAPCQAASSCDGDGGCVVTPAVDGTGCSDGDACTHGDRCAAGACVGTAYACAPVAPCQTASSCDGDGGCVVTAGPDGTGCNDGDACSAHDECRAGVCRGTRYTCTSTECAAASCLGDGGCAVTQVAAGTPCSAGACSDGACVPDGGSPDESLRTLRTGCDCGAVGPLGLLPFALAVVLGRRRSARRSSDAAARVADP